MPTFANITPAAAYDGQPYCVNHAVPTTEQDLADLPSPLAQEPPAALYGQCCVATVLFQAGPGAASPTYVVMQQDMGDNNWTDVAWCQWSGTSGSATFVLSAGAFAANAFQQTRAAGTAPGSNGSNNCPLGGRIRFVGQTGKGAASPSPSPSPSPGIAMQVTIRMKLLGLR